METTMRKCQCGNQVEDERIELLDSRVCSACAAKGIAQPAPLKGFMIYDHKTAPTICFMSESQFQQAKAATDRVGQESILNKIIKDIE
jgi:hypothetical protein